MTTETVCVPRDELLELLQDGVDDYWITTENGARIVEILRASLAQSVIPDWRAYSAQFARGEKCPETLETLQAAWARDQELIFDQKAQISRIKETINDLRQKLAAQPVAVVMPARMTTIPEGKTISYAAGYEDALDAVARLNRNTVPLELLERAARNLEIFNKRPVSMCRDCADCNGICQNTGLDCDVPALIKELRAILGAKP